MNFITDLEMTTDASHRCLLPDRLRSPHMPLVMVARPCFSYRKKHVTCGAVEGY